MQTAAILDRNEAAELLGIKPIEITRGVARGSLKAFKVGNGPERFTIDNLQSWLSNNRDTLIPPIDAESHWFFGENSLNHCETIVRNTIAHGISEDELRTTDAFRNAQKVYSTERKILQDGGTIYFNDAQSKLRAKPSTVTIGDKLDRYNTIATAAAVNRLRGKASQRMQMRDMVAESGKPLEKLYRNYDLLPKLATEVIQSVWQSIELRVEVADQLTGGKPHVSIRFAVKLQASLLPNATELVRLAF